MFAAIHVDDAMRRYRLAPTTTLVKNGNQLRGLNDLHRSDSAPWNTPWDAIISGINSDGAAIFSSLNRLDLSQVFRLVRSRVCILMSRRDVLLGIIWPYHMPENIAVLISKSAGVET